LFGLGKFTGDGTGVTTENGFTPLAAQASMFIGSNIIAITKRDCFEHARRMRRPLLFSCLEDSVIMQPAYE
jgi:hypothetical protein